VKPKAMIAVIQGFMDGKPIQYRQKNQGPGWCNHLGDDPGWNFDEYEYRLKPRGPRKCYVRWDGNELLCLDERQMEEPYDDDMRAEGWIEVSEVVK